MRRLVLSLAIGAFALLLAVPASAKGFSSATFTGPGLPPGGLRIHAGPGSDRTEAVLFQSGAFFDPKLARPSKVHLGPAYRMVLTPDWDRSSHVTVLLYPYASGGPWTYTPPNQSMGGGAEVMSGGWWRVGHRLIGSFSPRIARAFRALLVRQGFPAREPVPVTAAAAGAAPASRAPAAGATWPAWTWALLAIGSAGALLLVARRQRRRVAA